ncbi:homoserine dehydrogenase [Clostridium cochlearium]|jgi:homoserine dehydrogenase|uniref:Homoserine dehydrogenase n=1 Tax=Clostridium cochlearium TaxID=1494 RepID=A0A240AVK6_CLOCO|nr:homoserine dehydrogenase [Clostridium cochlearium]MBV1818875.1 homoserine dehydrogenase [Bacteroidales bacterium MSK.15.36]NSJ91143.1 homoserine dehydrogenase [Coprococcus sp. MSK.21.13]MBE6065837.1 homoserine dehydrogenase [Clostridium cochlearium]MCG4571658.1 homoserine dehydrogenase [Clostridium cochlearium]MCG4579776.1 homoserine dehydrogenase [Clostridium cochlearium]
MKVIKIGLLGLGNVGKGVWNILQMNKDIIKTRAGYNIEIGKILVKDANKKRDVDVPESIITTNVDYILEDPSIDIIVEVMGGVEPSFEYMVKAMKKGKHVITANKMVLAMKGRELSQIAKDNGVLFYYEASVGGGIPVIHGLTESLTANKINEVIGIINGTTNYILTKMTLEGLSFDEALKEAQQKGYAEADPTSDIEAFDAVYKLCILTSLGFDSFVDIKSVYREGITKIEPIDIKYAEEFGYVIKLLAIIKEEFGELELRVHPTMVPAVHPLANVNDSFNAIFIKGNAVGDLMLYGRGAGELPTGSAVVGDIISVIRNKEREENHFIQCDKVSKNVKDMSKVRSEYYIRITVGDKPGVLGEITTILGENNVSLLSVIQKGKRQEHVSLVFVTHRTNEGDVQKAIKKISELNDVLKVDNIIRIENLGMI